MADSAVSSLIDTVRLDARSKLLDLLDEVVGRKILVLDSSIVGPLDLIVNPSDLKDHGMHGLFKLSDTPVTTEGNQMVFLVRCAHVQLIDWIAAQILADEAAGRDRAYTVIFIPRKTEQCAERLSRGNVRANVTIVECNLHFFPFDRDVLSMEMPGVFHDFHVQGDPSSSFYAAKSLMYLQSHFGVIPQVHSIGGAGKQVVDIMLRLRKEEAMSDALKDPHPTRDIPQPGVPPVAPHATSMGKQGSGKTSQISEVILIDRRVDLFSVLCSQFTYQALIDTNFGLHNNSADLSSTDFGKDRNATIRLSPDEPFYNEIRDLHIDKLGPLLQQKAMVVQKIYDERDNVKNSGEMAEYIKKFKAAQAVHPLLELNINLARHLKGKIQSDEYRAQLKIEDDVTAGNVQGVLESLEDYIDDQRPFHEVMRLLCLYSMVNSGIKPKQLDQLKRSIVQAYGFEHLLTLCNAERVGMLGYHQGKSMWSSIKRSFNLFVEEPGAEKDISYAYSGYAPLSVRLVQMTKSLQKGWRSCQNELSFLYGPAQELAQPLDQNQSEAGATGEKTVVLVCFLGGVTYGEIAALRRLSELEEHRREFLIVTTEFTNSKKLFDSLRCEQVFNQAPIEARKAKASAAEPKRGFGFWPGAR